MLALVGAQVAAAGVGTLQLQLYCRPQDRFSKGLQTELRVTTAS